MQQKTEERFEIEIFSKYQELYAEPVKDRRDVYVLQFLDLITKWSVDHFFRKWTSTYQDEITEEVLKIAKKEKPLVFENAEIFMRYLRKMLSIAKKVYNINLQKEKSVIHIPRAKIAKLKNITDFIRMEECKLQKPLTEKEKYFKTSEWFNIPEEEVRFYLEKVANMTNTVLLNENIYDDFPDDDISNYNDEDEDYYNKEKNVKDIKDNSQNIDIDKFDKSEEIAKLKTALEEIFNDKQEKTKPLYRSLFTAQCLTDDIEFERLSKMIKYLKEYIDIEIWESFKNDIPIPTNKEIYLKYYPESKNPDQEVSNRLREFRNKLKEKDIYKLFSHYILRHCVY